MVDRPEWRTRADGALELFPFVGFKTGTLPEERTALGIQYATVLDELEPEKARVLQLTMTRSQVRALVQALGQATTVPHLDDPSGQVRH